MASRPYTSRRAPTGTADRVLDAAVALVEEDAFHSATMDELARRAGVSRATVFNGFGSKLGVLESLSLRCAGGPEMAAIRAAVDLDDPIGSLDALISASCELWEAEGFILAQLKAIAVLEPDASTLISEQYEDQRSSLERIVRRIDRAGLLATGVTPGRAVSALHMLTSLESFRALRADMSLKRTIAMMTELSRPLLSPA